MATQNSHIIQTRPIPPFLSSNYTARLCGCGCDVGDHFLHLGVVLGVTLTILSGTLVRFNWRSQYNITLTYVSTKYLLPRYNL